MEFLHRDAGTLTRFESVRADQMVVVSGMRVWSMCEHHILPFWCDITIGYITRDHVLGLSKFARIAHAVAGRLQVQERIVEDIARHVQEAAGCEDVAVLARGVGMDIVKTRISELNGTIDVDHASGRGTTFKFPLLVASNGSRKKGPRPA